MNSLAIASLIMVFYQGAAPPALPPIQPANAKPGLVSGPIPFVPMGLGVITAPDFLVVASGDNKLVRWKIEEWGVLASPVPVPNPIPSGVGKPSGFAFGKGILAVGTFEGKVLVCKGGETNPSLVLEAQKPVRALALSQDGLQLAAGLEDGFIQIWEIPSGKPKTKVQAGTEWVTGLAFSNDGKMLAAGTLDGFLKVWDLGQNKKMVDALAQAPVAANMPKPPVFEVSALAFSPDGKTIACSGGDPGIHLFQLPDGKLLRTLPGHLAPVTSLIFHPTGTLLVSASCDKTVRLWNPAGNLVKNLEGSPAWVVSAAFLPGFDRIITASVDGTARVWELSDKPKK